MQCKVTPQHCTQRLHPTLVADHGDSFEGSDAAQEGNHIDKGGKALAPDPAKREEANSFNRANWDMLGPLACSSEDAPVSKAPEEESIVQILLANTT